MNPVHADFNPATMRLFVTEGEIVAHEGQLKCGVHALMVVEEIPVPTLTTEQRVKFAILCAKVVCKNAVWNVWADKWLSGEDRSTRAAQVASWAASWAQAGGGGGGAGGGGGGGAAAAAVAAVVEAGRAAAETRIDLIQIVEQL